jgi:hypothetical protein
MVDSLNAKPYGSDRDTDDKYEDGRGIALALIKNEDSEIVFIKQDGNDVYFEVIKKK